LDEEWLEAEESSEEEEPSEEDESSELKEEPEEKEEDSEEGREEKENEEEDKMVMEEYEAETSEDDEEESPEEAEAVGAEEDPAEGEEECWEEEEGSPHHKRVLPQNPDVSMQPHALHHPTLLQSHWLSDVQRTRGSKGTRGSRGFPFGGTTMGTPQGGGNLTPPSPLSSPFLAPTGGSPGPAPEFLGFRPLGALTVAGSHRFFTQRAVPQQGG